MDTKLPAESYGKIKERFAAKKQGTVFGGHAAVGASIHDILAREDTGLQTSRVSCSQAQRKEDDDEYADDE